MDEVGLFKSEVVVRISNVALTCYWRVVILHLRVNKVFITQFHTVHILNSNSPLWAVNILRHRNLCHLSNLKLGRRFGLHTAEVNSFQSKSCLINIGPIQHKMHEHQCMHSTTKNIVVLKKKLNYKGNQCYFSISKSIWIYCSVFHSQIALIKNTA